MGLLSKVLEREGFLLMVVVRLLEQILSVPSSSSSSCLCCASVVNGSADPCGFSLRRIIVVSVVAGVSSKK